MKKHFRRCLAAAALMSLTAVLLVAADAAGTWKGSFDFNGDAVALTFNLKTSGAAVTGTVDGLPTAASEIKDGKVDGDTITFWSMTDYQGMPVKLVYSGKLVGDQISFTMKTEDGSLPSIYWLSAVPELKYLPPGTCTHECAHCTF